jgi:hypothetical protein
MSKSLKDSAGIYARFIEFEEKAASIYLHLASHFSDDPKLSGFWFDIGMQEKQHAGLLQFCLADELFAPDLPDRTEIKEVTKLFKRLEKQAADPGLTIEQAFMIAMELETSEINGIYRYLTTPLHRSVYLLRRKIATCMNHSEEVVEGANRFGVKIEAMKELQALKNACSDEWKGRKRLRPAS